MSQTYKDEINTASVKLAGLFNNKEFAAEGVSVEKKDDNLIITIDSSKIRGDDDHWFGGIGGNIKKHLEAQGVQVSRKDVYEDWSEATRENNHKTKIVDTKPESDEYGHFLTKPILTITAPDTFDSVQKLDKARFDFVVEDKTRDFVREFGGIKNKIYTQLSQFFDDEKLEKAYSRVLENAGLQKESKGKAA